MAGTGKKADGFPVETRPRFVWCRKGREFGGEWGGDGPDYHVVRYGCLLELTFGEGLPSSQRLSRCSGRKTESCNREGRN